MTKTIHAFVQSTAFDKDNNEVVLLTAQEFPWSVLQVVPTPVEKHDAIIENLKATHWIGKVNSRKDFIILHSGSGGEGEKHINITQENHEEISFLIQDCMRQAAAWWAQITEG